MSVLTDIKGQRRLAACLTFLEPFVEVSSRSAAVLATSATTPKDNLVDSTSSDLSDADDLAIVRVSFWPLKKYKERYYWFHFFFFRKIAKLGCSSHRAFASLLAQIASARLASRVSRVVQVVSESYLRNLYWSTSLTRQPSTRDDHFESPDRARSCVWHGHSLLVLIRLNRRRSALAAIDCLAHRTCHRLLCIQVVQRSTHTILILLSFSTF